MGRAWDRGGDTGRMQRRHMRFTGKVARMSAAAVPCCRSWKTVITPKRREETKREVILGP